MRAPPKPTFGLVYEPGSSQRSARGSRTLSQSRYFLSAHGNSLVMHLTACQRTSLLTVCTTSDFSRSQADEQLGIGWPKASDKAFTILLRKVGEAERCPVNRKGNMFATDIQEVSICEDCDHGPCFPEIISQEQLFTHHAKAHTAKSRSVSACDGTRLLKLSPRNNLLCGGGRHIARLIFAVSTTDQGRQQDLGGPPRPARRTHVRRTSPRWQIRRRLRRRSHIRHTERRRRAHC